MRAPIAERLLLTPVSFSPIQSLPWPGFSNWSEEDRHAVVVYLRHLKPIAHRIPAPLPGNAVTIPGAIEQDYAAKDYGVK